MKCTSFFFLSLTLILFACKNKTNDSENSVIASGQMPNVVVDQSSIVHMVFGSGDSILYSYSSDKGKTFSSPALIAELPKLTADHMRGPQIAATASGLIVTACNNPGNIFSYKKDESGAWTKTGKVNDVDTIAKENLMALAADRNNVFAVWLDLRTRQNQIFGAKSIDGGKTWLKNQLVYASPETHVCECCKPSVAVKGNNVYVMFRNWLHGDRDLYLIQSSDGGNSFGQAQKLGNGSWALNGCPMDGGALTISNIGNAETVWNRKGMIYSCEPGKQEIELGKGKNCSIETVNGKNVYAWVNDNNVIVRKPHGIEMNFGKGQLPILKAINKEHVLCIWEDDKQIHKTILEL